MWKIVRYFSKSIAKVLNCCAKRSHVESYVYFCMEKPLSNHLHAIEFHSEINFQFFFSFVCLSVNSFVQQWVKSNVICKCGWNKCKNFVFLLLDACKSKIICKRKSAEAGVQIAWRSCLRIFLRMLRVSFECRVCVVFQSTFELSFSHRHANTIVRISNGFLFFFSFSFCSFVFFYSFILREKKKWLKSVEWTTPKWNRNVRNDQFVWQRKEERNTINH